MSVVTAQQIRLAAKGKVDAANLNSVLVALDRFGAGAGLDQLHRLVHYLAQLMHESGSFRYDQEIWGPTPAQQRYDTRTDLGNTAAKDGDGYLYRGRAGIQITGKANYTAFRDWCRKKGYNPPDFVAKPDLINADPWEGLVPIWYWTERNLNRWADQNDIETITKKINGGKNGLADRIDYFGRLSLVVLGYGVDEEQVKRFQRDNRLDADGDVGPKTRSALFKRLVSLGGAASSFVSSSPVIDRKIVETTVEVAKPVLPSAVDEKVKKKFNLFGWIGGLFGGGGLSLAGLAGMDWQAIIAIGVVFLVITIVALVLRHQILAAFKDIRSALEA